jgi:hypothetical protein
VIVEVRERNFPRGWDAPVYVDGEQLDPAHSQRVFNHSPDGFAWGYGGSGPAQLALAILLAAGLDEDQAVRLHQEFKWEFVEPLPQEGPWSFEIDVDEWVAERDRTKRAAAMDGLAKERARREGS